MPGVLRCSAIDHDGHLRKAVSASGIGRRSGQRIRVRAASPGRSRRSRSSYSTCSSDSPCIACSTGIPEVQYRIEAGPPPFAASRRPSAAARSARAISESTASDSFSSRLRCTRKLPTTAFHIPETALMLRHRRPPKSHGSSDRITLHSALPNAIPEVSR